MPTTVDSNGWVGEESSIDVDQGGKVHISYFDNDNSDLKYATNAGGSWTSIVLDYKGTTGMDTGLAIGTDDKVHISYYDGTGTLGYATNSPWKITTIRELGYVPNAEDAMALAIDDAGAHHVAFYDRSITGLRYATDISGSWSTTIVEEEGAVGQYCDIAVDSNRKAHICYFDAANNDLWYATNAGGSWATVKVDETGLVGTYASIAVDQNNKNISATATQPIRDSNTRPTPAGAGSTRPWTISGTAVLTPPSVSTKAARSTSATTAGATAT